MIKEEFRPLDDGSHARQLADRLVKFWAAQGYEIDVTITKERSPTTHFALRTNLHNGLPAGFRTSTKHPRTVVGIPLSQLKFRGEVRP